MFLYKLLAYAYNVATLNNANTKTNVHNNANANADNDTNGWFKRNGFIRTSCACEVIWVNSDYSEYTEYLFPKERNSSYSEQTVFHSLCYQGQNKRKTE